MPKHLVSLFRKVFATEEAVPFEHRQHFDLLRAAALDHAVVAHEELVKAAAPLAPAVSELEVPALETDFID